MLPVFSSRLREPCCSNRRAIAESSLLADFLFARETARLLIQSSGLSDRCFGLPGDLRISSEPEVEESPGSAGQGGR